MANTHKKLLFKAELTHEHKLLSDNEKKSQIIQLPSVRIPLTISVRLCNKKVEKGFQLPFIELDQPNEKLNRRKDLETARCILKVWELDRWKQPNRKKVIVDDSSLENAENKLLGEIKGFIKQTTKKPKKNFLFITDQVPPSQPASDDQNIWQITIKIPQLSSDGRINHEGINWVLNVTEELEIFLEVGISLESMPAVLDYKNIAFPYSFIRLHKISCPPKSDEIFMAWKEKWNIWNKRGIDHIGCDTAAKQVCELLGGRWSDTTIWHRPSASKGWYRCTEEDGYEALQRYNRHFERREDFNVRWNFKDRIIINRKPDNSIESVVCRVYKGKPFKDDNGKWYCNFDDLNDYALKPGMLLYTAELCLKWPCKDYIDDPDDGCFNCKKERGIGWRWHSNHFVMYYDNDEILDCVDLEFQPEPRNFEPIWILPRSKIFILLRIHDPFISMR